MTVGEILIGALIAITFLGLAVFLAFRSPRQIGPRRHGVRGDGDYSVEATRRADFDSGGGGGDGGGD